MPHSPTAPATLPSVLWTRLGDDAARDALLIHDGERFVPQTWGDALEPALRAADALFRLGIAPGDRVATISENRTEWLQVDFACSASGAVHAAMHSVLGPRELAAQIADCKPSAIVVSTAEIAERLASIGGELPADVPILAFEETPKIGGRTPERWGRLAADASADRGRALLEQTAARTKPGDLAALIYTSGTTGGSKGVMLSHDNFVSNTLAASRAYGYSADDRRLCWLPLSHVFAHTCDLYAWLLVGGEMALCRGRDFVLDDCRAVRPTQLSGVPYFYEKAADGLRKAGAADAPGALAAMFGGRIDRLGSGGAPLPDHVAEFYEARGVSLVQGYGLTESSPVISASTPEANRRGAVGRPIPGVEVRISDDGEILTRGRHVMLGYYGLPEETAAVVRDGWLHTGDLGRIDDDGFLWITGRKKELIVTSAGKNVAPTFLESLLVDDPLIDQALVLGDRRKFLAALIVPDVGALASFAESAGVTAAGAALLEHGVIVAEYRRRIDAALAGLAQCEQIGRFRLVSEPFTIAAGELTPKLSLAREVVAKRRAAVIESLYEPSSG